MALIAIVALLVACAWVAPLDATANRQIDAGLKRALVSFAAARTMNAVISVAQGTAISLQPMGVGVNLTVGQVLEPVNHVIEQFSTLMLVASVAFGIQKVLVGVGAHWLVSLLVTVTAAGWAVLLLRRKPAPWLMQCLVVLLMIRFAIPVVTIGGDLVFQHFMAADYASSQSILDRTATQAGAANPVGVAADKQSLFETMKSWAGSQEARLKENFASLKRAAEQATEHVIRLMVIFVLQTLVVPLALLWLLCGLARGLLRSRR